MPRAESTLEPVAPVLSRWRQRQAEVRAQVSANASSSEAANPNAWSGAANASPSSPAARQHRAPAQAPHPSGATSQLAAVQAGRIDRFSSSIFRNALAASAPNAGGEPLLQPGTSPPPPQDPFRSRGGVVREGTPFCRCGCAERARQATTSDTITTTRGTMNVTGNAELNSSAQEDANLEVIRCCRMPPWLTGIMMIFLCVIDLLHVAATMVSMAKLAKFGHSSDDCASGNGSGTGMDDCAENQVVPINARYCFILYVVKVTTTLALVVFRLNCCPGHGVKPDDNTNRWRANQTWFVAMTFNSFMMIYVYLFVPTDCHGNAWHMVKRSIRRQYKVTRSADGSQPADLEDNANDVRPDDKYLTLQEHDYVSVSDEVIHAHNDQVERYTRCLKGVRHDSDHVEVFDSLSGKQEEGRFLICCIEDTLERDEVTDHIIAAESGEIEWTDAGQGILDTFSRIGSGGIWDLAITYAMAMNVICTAYAFLINLRAMKPDAPRFQYWVSTVSIVSIAAHFLVSLFLYMFTKLYRTQRRPHATPVETTWRSIVAVFLGLVDAGTITLTILLIFAYQANPDSDAIWHGDLGQVPKAWTDVAPSWLVAVVLGMSAQVVLIVRAGKQLIDRQKAREGEAKQGVLVTTQALNMFVDYQSASDRFQGLAFNTWAMPLVLTWLPNPFRHNLLSSTRDRTPFEVFIPGNAKTQQLGQPVHNNDVLASLCITIVTLSRFVGTCGFIFVGVATLLPSWGKTALAESCNAFPCSDTSLVILVAFFLTQMSISYWFSFLHSAESWAVRLAYAGMFFLCLLDAATTSVTGYFAICILDSSDQFQQKTTGIKNFLNCPNDFGANFSQDWTAKHTNSNELYGHISLTVLTLFALKFIVQNFGFARRRLIATYPPEDDNMSSQSTTASHDQSCTPAIRNSRIRVDDVPEPTSAIINGCLHGLFLLCALFPHDLAKLLNGRWSPIQMQPHWSNAVIQLIVLLEKTAMGFLVMDLLLLDPTEGDEGSGRSAVIWLFCIESAVQMFGFVYVQVIRPGRRERVERGDHLVEHRSLPLVHASDSFATTPRCQPCGEAVGTVEVREIWEIGPALDSNDPGLSDRSSNNLHYCVAKSGGGPYICGCQIQAGNSAVTIEGQRNTGASIAVVSPDLQSNKQSNYDRPQRAVSHTWSLVVIFLAFLDWFHVAYNLNNLQFLIDANLWDCTNGSNSSESVCVHADWNAQNPDGRWCVRLCWFCIGFYVVRLIVQPLTIVVRGGRSMFSNQSSFSEEWEKDAVWYTAITFNTLLMLPSLMFVRNAYRDRPRMVHDAFVHLGRKGWKDTLPGLLLLLMVLKKTVNFYLIVRFLGTPELESNDSDASGHITQQYISIALLVAHFAVTIYTMMIPKLMNSQKGKRWVKIAKSSGLLTIALVDWGNLFITLLAVNQNLGFATGEKSINFGECDNKDVIKNASVSAAVLLIVRVCFQTVSYIYLRYKRGPAPSSTVRFTGTLRNMAEIENYEGTDQEEKRRREVWQNEFQALTFNTWMMVFALLFVEKPYHPNLLSSGDDSPFRRPRRQLSGCSGLTLVGWMYFIMIAKKAAVITMNAATFLDNPRCQEDSRGSVAIVGLVLSTAHILIWVFTLGRQMGAMVDRRPVTGPVTGPDIDRITWSDPASSLRCSGSTGLGASAEPEPEPGPQVSGSRASTRGRGRD